MIVVLRFQRPANESQEEAAGASAFGAAGAAGAGRVVGGVAEVGFMGTVVKLEAVAPGIAIKSMPHFLRWRAAGNGGIFQGEARKPGNGRLRVGLARSWLPGFPLKNCSEWMSRKLPAIAKTSARQG
jgi:hypothetical protein